MRVSAGWHFKEADLLVLVQLFFGYLVASNVTRMVFEWILYGFPHMFEKGTARNIMEHHTGAGSAMPRALFFEKKTLCEQTAWRG